jgi:hypothetical protein
VRQEPPTVAFNDKGHMAATLETCLRALRLHRFCCVLHGHTAQIPDSSKVSLLERAKGSFAHNTGGQHRKAPITPARGSARLCFTLPLLAERANGSAHVTITTTSTIVFTMKHAMCSSRLLAISSQHKCFYDFTQDPYRMKQVYCAFENICLKPTAHIVSKILRSHVP